MDIWRPKSNNYSQKGNIKIVLIRVSNGIYNIILDFSNVDQIK